MNKIFADFLGWEFEPAYRGANPTRFDKWLCPFNSFWVKEEQMKFQTDWNWFLEVWKKASDEISGAEYGSTYNGLKAKIMMAICDVNLENACKYLVELIEADLKMKVAV